jgi:hypothetical protein
LLDIYKCVNIIQITSVECVQMCQLTEVTTAVIVKQI